MIIKFALKIILHQLKLISVTQKLNILKCSLTSDEKIQFLYLKLMSTILVEIKIVSHSLPIIIQIKENITFLQNIYI